jgi:hypothetical protein
VIFSEARLEMRDRILARDGGVKKRSDEWEKLLSDVER